MVSEARRRSVRAGGSAVLATATPAVVNVATSSPGLATVIGLVVLTGVYAGWEWLGAAKGQPEIGGPPDKVRIRTGRVRRGKVTGWRGTRGAPAVDIGIETGDVTDGSEVTGYEQG